MLEPAPPVEAEIGGIRYRCRELSAVDQWSLFLRLQPVLPAANSIDAVLAAPDLTAQKVLSSIGDLRTLTDEEVGAAFEACTGAVEQQDGDTWVEVPRGVSLPLFLNLLRLVVVANFTAFFTMERPKFQPVDTGAPRYDLVVMPNGEDWLWRPVLRGLCKAESLYDGTLRIEHVARFNAMLDVADENEARARMAVRNANG